MGFSDGTGASDHVLVQLHDVVEPPPADVPLVPQTRGDETPTQQAAHATVETTGADPPPAWVVPACAPSRKTIYTLNIDGYAPSITALTYPLLQRYAEKIGAAFYVIQTRHWPGWPPVYEKLQIRDLARARGDEWAIYIDSDAIVHPDMFDVTEHLSRDTVCHHGVDMASVRWTYDEYFRRDGRHIGSCNWFTVASSWCLDLWTPLDLTLEDAVRRIHPTHAERSSVITPEHLIDDYTLSRNIARFGLKCTTVRAMQEAMKDSGNFLWHQYTLTTDEKVAQMRQVLTDWKLG